MLTIMNLILFTAVVVSIPLALLLVFGFHNAFYAFRLVYWARQCLQNKVEFEPVVSSEIVPWTEPLSREELIETLGTEKIIWGYWQQGAENLPGLCDLAVQSWKLHHPDWSVIILSEDNYKTYVSSSDIPSTFDSLKVQFRSDIVRTAVLRRYGGVYLDISYIVLKAFDEIWQTSKANNDLYLTSLWTLKCKKRDMVVPNICLMVAPQPQNPLLTAWHQTLLDFFEKPSFTMNEMKKNPALSRVSELMDHPSLGQLRSLSPYLVSLWTLAQTLYYNTDVQDYVKDHVYFLPTLLWTFDAMMTSLFTTPEEKIYSFVNHSESPWTWIRRAPNVIRLVFQDDSAAATKFATYANAVKASTDFSPYFHTETADYHLNLETTQGRIWRAALDETAPTQQASTKGAYRIVPVSNDSDSESSTANSKLTAVLSSSSSQTSSYDIEMGSSTSSTSSSNEWDT